MAPSTGSYLAGSRLFGLVLVCLLMAAATTTSGYRPDPVTGFPQQSIVVDSWPGDKKVAVCFVFYVEVWGFGHGPDFRPDMVKRKPDLVNEYYRQYGINEGIDRIGRLFARLDVPLSVALSALFPDQRPEIWASFREIQPGASIIAHGMNNSTEQLPLAQGLKAQEVYVRKTLDLVEKSVGVRPKGWSSPSVYANVDTYTATAAEGIKYSLDAMDSDELSRLQTPSGSLLMIPYPVVTVDMGQNLARQQMPVMLEQLWTDYVMELVHEAEVDPDRPATVVAIGIHPFVSGTPSGAAALRRVLERIKEEKLVWLTDVDSIYDHALGQ
ncbi:MAG: polysaccharide deacetylase [Phycisphaerae bacterium]|nr:polysaccharide deacetylase [Phycisphaerae bacterium]